MVRAVRISNRCRAAALALVPVLVCFATAARAAGACDGSIQASALRPLPDPLTVAIQATRSAPEEEKVRQRFVDAMQASGVTVEPTGSVVMRLSFLVTAMEEGGRPRQFSDFSWASATGTAAPIITATITLSDPQRGTLIWVATLQCRMKQRDPEALAAQLGQVIGQTLGTHVSERTF